MFSRTSHLSGFSIALSILNSIASILLLVFIFYTKLEMSVKFFALMYTASSCISITLLSFCLRSTCQDLTFNDETYTARIKELRKRIENLENKSN